MLPQGFTRVEWIESTGTQYIDTGVKPNQNTRIVMDAIPMSVGGASGDCGMLFGSGYPVQQKGFEAYAFSGMITGVYNGVQKDGSAVSAGQRVVVDFNKNVCKITADGTVVLNHTFTAATFTSPVSLALFVLPRQSRYYGRVQMHRCQIYDNGTLVRDYIPCIDENGDANLWDDVEEALAEKVGTFIAGPVVPTAGDLNTLLLLHGADVTDASPYERKLTNYGVTASDAQSKFGGKSLYFNGSSYMRIEDIDILPATGDFTIDWWEYRTASAEGSVVFHQPVKAKDGTGTIFGYGYQGLVNAYIGNTSGNFNIMPQTSMGTEVLNRWVHRAVVRSGNQFLLFADGILQNSVTSSAALARNITPYIGRYDSGNYLYYQGYIDEFRISDVARWTANFTPPTAEYNPTAFVPEAPQEVRAETAGSTTALTWSASAQAEKYRVYRDYSVIAETVSTEHIDTITDAPAAHVYAVTAVNEFGESALSGSVRADIWGDTAPELIYDRTQADVNDAKVLISKYMRGEPLGGYEQELWDKGLRGCYNTSDVNRVEYHTRELQNILNANGYNIQIDTRLWSKPDIMRYSDIVRYLGNINAILDAFGRSANAPKLPGIDRWIDYIAANDIEKILYVTRELVYGTLAMFRRAGTFTAGNDYVTQVIRRA